MPVRRRHGRSLAPIDGDPGFGSPKAQTSLKGSGEHSLRFANVDDELRLWIDGRPVEFDVAAVYPPLGNYIPTEADLLPAGIASKGVELEVSGLACFAICITSPISGQRFRRTDVGFPGFRTRTTTG